MPEIIQKGLSEKEVKYFKKVFKTWLTKEDLEQIAANHDGCHLQHVRNVLYGLRNNDAIYNEALTIAAEKQRIQREDIEALKKTVA